LGPTQPPVKCVPGE